jgi:hypothetical protein
MASSKDDNPPAIDPPWPKPNGIWATYDLHCVRLHLPAIPGEDRPERVLTIL